MKITIECSKNQADIILHALEDFFRLRMGQSDCVAQSLVDDVTDIHDDIDNYLDKRAMLESAYRMVVVIAYPRIIHSSDTCRNASDLWSSIRHALYKAEPHDPDSWDTRSREPIQLGTEPLPKVEVEL